MFIAFAMVYHGVLLYIIRKSGLMDISESEMSIMDELEDSIFKWDKKMAVLYVLMFVLFNILFFIGVMTSIAI